MSVSFPVARAVGQSVASNVAGAGDFSPSLSLNFLSGALDSRITFTRGSSGTYYTSTGILATAASGVARFDYNPATLEARGLLIEEARTNICLQSEDFTTTWSAVGVTVSGNQSVAPDGVTTADLLTETATFTTHRVSQSSLAVTSGTTYTLSTFVKAGTRTSALLVSGGGLPTAGISVNLLTGAVSTATGSPSSSFTQTLPNGWYRVGFSVAATSTTGSNMDIFVSQDGVYANRTYTGSTTSTLLVWGAQMEAGAFPTSYIATTTTSVTRNIDQADITTLTPWYNVSQGSMVASVERAFIPTAATNPVLWSFNDGSSVNRILGAVGTSPNQRLLTISNSTTEAVIEVVGNGTGFNKLSAGWALNNTNQATNGTLGTLDSSCTVPAGITQLSIGKDRATTNPYNGWIRSLAYYSTRLPDSTLQTLSV